MDMEHDDEVIAREIQIFLSRRSVSPYYLGAFLRFDVDRDASTFSEYRAIRLLQAVDFLPTESSIVICEQSLRDGAGNPLVDQQGQPEQCGLAMRVNYTPDRRLGFRWRCTGSHKLGGTGRLDRNRSHPPVRISPLHSTIFEGSKLWFKEFLKIVVGFVHSGRVKDTLDIGVSKPCIIEWFKMIREALAIAGWHDQGKIGGPGDVVEVDEVLLVKRKNNTGRIPAGHHWVFGGISRTTKKR